MPTHKLSGIPIDEWVDRIPSELEIDAIGLWQITPVLIRDFDLSGTELEFYVRKTIFRLVSHGAFPIDGKSWEVRNDLCINMRPDIDLIVSYCLSLDSDPTFEDIWFVIP